MILDHTHPDYIKRRGKLGKNKYNGAYYYSREIVDKIIPLVDTDYNWVTVDAGKKVQNHSIVFIHDNLRPSRYWHLKTLEDIICVCGVKETVPKMRGYGTSILLPLSIDVEYVKAFSAPKTRKAAFAGRRSKTRFGHLPKNIDHLSGMKREDMLAEMAKYKYVYAVGRTAIEARALGCEILPYDMRYPDPEVWQVLDSKDAAKILQYKLEKIERNKTLV